MLLELPCVQCPLLFVKFAVLANKCGQNFIKLPTTEQEMAELVSKMENRFGFPHLEKIQMTSSVIK